MKISRRTMDGSEIVSPRKRNRSKSTLVFDLPTLDLYCRFVLSENRSIRTSNFSTMKKLFDRFDRNSYINDPDKLIRFDFIRRGLSARVDYKLKDRYLICQCINGGPTDKELLDPNQFDELSNEQIEWIVESLSDISQFMVLTSTDSEALLMALTKAQSTDVMERKSDLIKEIENYMASIQHDLRRAKMDTNVEPDFSLEAGEMEDRVTDVYMKSVNPSRKLKTGMQGFNQMVGGGLESQRVYILFGIAGGGKSFTLLDLAYQIKKYNANYICHDVTKKPCIIILTMENSVTETIARLHVLMSGKDIASGSLDDAINAMKNNGLVITDDNPINIIIRYRPNLSVDTSYLYTMCEEFAEKGYEPMLVIQDHIKRIKPVYEQYDLRLNLGEIVNEFKTFANLMDIPVITNSHLNRDAVKAIEEATRRNKNDITKNLSSSNVSESMLMIDNCDGGIIINKEPGIGKDAMNGYMGFKEIKMRTECKIPYFAQPYLDSNAVKLVEDFGMPTPVYLRELGNDIGSRLNNNIPISRNLETDELRNYQQQYYNQPGRLMDQMNQVIGGGVFRVGPSNPQQNHQIYDPNQQIRVNIPISENNMKDSLIPFIYFEDDDGIKYYEDANGIKCYL